MNSPTRAANIETPSPGTANLEDLEGIWFGSPEYYLIPNYDRLHKSMYAGLPTVYRQEPIPIADFEIDAIPAVRTFDAEFCRNAALALSHAISRSKGDCNTYTSLETPDLNSLSQKERLIRDLASFEISEILLQLDPRSLVIARIAGSDILKRDRDEQNSLAYLPDGLINHLGSEIKHAVLSVARLLSNNSQSELDETNSVAVYFMGLSDRKVAELATVFLALLPDSTIERLYYSVPQYASGLAPFFRVFDADLVVKMSQDRLSNDFGLNKLTQDLGLDVKSISLFPELITLQQLKIVRSLGSKVISKLIEVGEEISGITDPLKSPEFDERIIAAMSAREIGSGERGFIPDRLVALMAYYFNLAITGEAARLARISWPLGSAANPSALKVFDRKETPNQEYVPYIYSVYAFASFFSDAMRLENSQATLIKKFFDRNPTGEYAQYLRSNDLTLPNSPEAVTPEELYGVKLGGNEPNILAGADIVFKYQNREYRPKPQEIAGFLTSKMLADDIQDLAPVFSYLDSLGDLPLAHRCKEIYEQLIGVANARNSLLRDIISGLDGLRTFPLNRLLRPLKDSPANAILTAAIKALDPKISETVSRKRAKYQEIKRSLVEELQQHRAPPMMQIFIGGCSDSLTSQIRALIVDKVSPDFAFRAQRSAFKFDDFYSLKFISDYLACGNCILIQGSEGSDNGIDRSDNLSGINLFGNSGGVLPTGISNLTKSYALDAPYEMTELVVTSSKRPSGTYMRLMRGMCAHMALRGNKASLGFVHIDHKHHTDLLKAAGHTLFPNAKFQLATKDGKKPNTYIPAWLQFID